jgi:predicted ABC-type ATPase
MPHLYIISGCNGAGKTTASNTVLPDVLHCKEFVNADNIAAGLSPFNPESVAIEAGRLMLKRIKELIAEKADFAFETTLAAKSFIPLIKMAQDAGYEVILSFFWLSSPNIAIDRVKDRVNKGGHNIPKDIIIRRYYRGIFNLIHFYIPICNSWIIFNNTKGESEMVAKGEFELNRIVENQYLWNIALIQSRENEP